MTTSLDRKTLNRVAELICDIGSPSERHGYELEQLLRDAGWSDPPEYDGSTSRVRWLTEALADRAEEHGDIVRLLCRICDPLEYDGGMPVAESFRIELNRILEPERLAVSYEDFLPDQDTVALCWGPVHAVLNDLEEHRTETTG